MNDIQHEMFPEHNGHGPWHPCYYLSGGQIIPHELITPCDYPDELLDKRDKLEVVEAELEKEIKRYMELAEKGIKAVSRFDIEVASGGDEQKALACSLMLIHNHIKAYKGKIVAIKRKELVK